MCLTRLVSCRKQYIIQKWIGFSKLVVCVLLAGAVIAILFLAVLVSTR